MTDKTASAATYVASGSAVAFGLSANEFAAICGAAIAVLSFLVNLWFKYQHLKIARAKAGCVSEVGDDE